ncbi:hypothetical protein J2Z21_001244 [Streptomyces griseochromogenes]|uniref:Uncharacterized protein n=1 Tax=Streptomyces griseochromogenes TaxID=68214 RepID=A0ABS4LLQ0_9ACTN|nr:hypothetical protein [Streptomyces griseochromogenes]
MSAPKPCTAGTSRLCAVRKSPRMTWCGIGARVPGAAAKASAAVWQARSPVTWTSGWCPAARACRTTASVSAVRSVSVAPFTHREPQPPCIQAVLQDGAVAEDLDVVGRKAARIGAARVAEAREGAGELLGGARHAVGQGGGRRGRLNEDLAALMEQPGGFAGVDDGSAGRCDGVPVDADEFRCRARALRWPTGAGSRRGRRKGPPGHPGARRASASGERCARRRRGRPARAAGRS